MPRPGGRPGRAPALPRSSGRARSGARPGRRRPAGSGNRRTASAYPAPVLHPRADHARSRPPVGHSGRPAPRRRPPAPRGSRAEQHVTPRGDPGQGIGQRARVAAVIRHDQVGGAVQRPPCVQSAGRLPPEPGVPAGQRQARTHSQAAVARGGLAGAHVPMVSPVPSAPAAQRDGTLAAAIGCHRPCWQAHSRRILDEWCTDIQRAPPASAARAGAVPGHPPRPARPFRPGRAAARRNRGSK